jgi:hypothetical protein|tara:strand:- start:6299 stop:6901 length:603 start_codon:yes stop_codon:yes gene_type:complete
MSITLGFVLVAALALWFIIGSKGHWLSKALVIFASLYFCLSVGFSVKDYMGWPTEESLPKKFLVHWIVIQEPDKKTGDKGAIYVWTKPLSKVEDKTVTWEDYLLSFYDGKSKPRAHRMSYSRDMHEKAQQAIDTIRSGGQIGGQSGQGKEGDGDGNAEKGKASNGTGENAKGQGGGSLTRNGGVIFHKLPPPRLPDKVGG